jgi:predicted RNA binding protein YcfA (HicA-like mRNA interferase family)
VKVPRDLTGIELVRALRRFGYEVVRQTGSHMRLTRHHAGEDLHITIPGHKSLKIGTLNNILGDIASQVGMTKDELVKKLFS